ncbi:MAG: endonuclease V [Thermoplasmata archaeon]
MKFELNIYDEFYKLMEQIPEGYVTTYGDIAVALGDIIASRAVGQMLSNNKNPAKYPCHRVVNSDGSLGGFTHSLGTDEKMRRLKKEGIVIVNGKIDNFDIIRFKDFKTDFPLQRYREWSNGLKMDESDDRPDCLRALDISYIGDTGIGVGVTFKERIEFQVAVREVKSPYIPNYLYLREGEIYETLTERGCINMIDGNGILHRDRKGVATVVGIVKGVSTIGIAKKLLTGVIKSDKVYIDDEEVGRIYDRYIISKGNKIDFEYAYRRIVGSKYFPHTKYPDKLSRRYRNEILPAEYSL